MTYFELAAFLAKLPAESALRTEQRDELSDDELAELAERNTDAPHGAWSRTDMLLAASFDALMTLVHVQVRRGGVDLDPPEPVRRPGVTGRRRPMNPQHIAYLQAIRDRHARQQAELEEVDGT